MGDKLHTRPTFIQPKKEENAYYLGNVATNSRMLVWSYFSFSRVHALSSTLSYGTRHL